MTERRVQYLTVDADSAPWSSEAPSFLAQVTDKTSLETAVHQRVEPSHSRLLLRDIDNMWVAWRDIRELPQDGILCVKAVRTGVESIGATESFWDLWVGPLSMEAEKLRETLMERFSPTKSKRQHTATETYKRLNDSVNDFTHEASCTSHKATMRRRPLSQVC